MGKEKKKMLNLHRNEIHLLNRNQKMMVQIPKKNDSVKRRRENDEKKRSVNERRKSVNEQRKRGNAKNERKRNVDGERKKKRKRNNKKQIPHRISMTPISLRQNESVWNAKSQNVR